MADHLGQGPGLAGPPRKSPTDIQLGTWWRPAARWTATIVHVALIAALAVPWFAAFAIYRNPYLTAPGDVVLIFAALAMIPPSPKRFNARQLRTRLGLKRFAVRFMVVFAAGLTLGLVIGLVLGLSPNNGFLSGFSGWTPERVRPWARVRARARCSRSVAPRRRTARRHPGRRPVRARYRAHLRIDHFSRRQVRAASVRTIPEHRARDRALMRTHGCARVRT